MTKHEIENYSYALSDVLCFLSGLSLASKLAGVEDETDLIDRHQLRKLNLKLKGMLNKIDQQERDEIL